MKLIIRIIAIAGLTYLISPFTDWWVIIIIAFLVSFISPSSALNAFIAGFLGVGLVWMLHAWSLDIENASAFSSKISKIIEWSDPLYLVIASGVIGGGVAGFASISGTTFRQIFEKPKKKKVYH